MTDQVVVGRVVRVHGLRGEVVLDPSSDVPGRYDAGAAVRVDGTERTIASSRAHQGRLLVRFEGIDDRTAAEALRDAVVTAPPVDLSDSETYYVHELVGMAVVDVDGTWLGDVVEVVEVPSVAAYDLLEVDMDGTRWLLPDADDLVEIADADGVDVLCVVDPPPGLLPGDVERESEPGEDAAEVVRPDESGDA